jgi:hypothetical protein
LVFRPAGRIFLGMNTLHRYANLTDLMSAVGFLLLRWGWVERRLNSGPFPSELLDVRQMRNRICHGLQAASADPNCADEPTIRGFDLNGAAWTYSYSDLLAAIQALESAGGRQERATD